MGIARLIQLQVDFTELMNAWDAALANPEQQKTDDIFSLQTKRVDEIRRRAWLSLAGALSGAFQAASGALPAPWGAVSGIAAVGFNKGSELLSIRSQANEALGEGTLSNETRRRDLLTEARRADKAALDQLNQMISSILATRGQMVS